MVREPRFPNITRLHSSTSETTTSFCNMIIVKVSLGLEIKRIALDDSGATLQSILSLLKILFPVLENQPFVLKYKDDEGDTISILTDLELKECFRQVLEKKTSQTPVLRLWIDTGNSQNQPMPLKEDSVLPQNVQQQLSPPSQLNQEQQESSQQTQSSSGQEVPNANVPLYPQLETKNETTQQPKTLPLTPLKSSTSSIQKSAEFDLLKTIERHLQTFCKTIMNLVHQMNINNKVGQLLESCHKHLRVCQEKLNLMSATIGKNVENIGKNIENIAKQTRDDFHKEFGILKRELKNLRNEIANELRKAAEAQKERKDAGKVYFPPLLLFKNLHVDSHSTSSNQTTTDTTTTNPCCCCCEEPKSQSPECCSSNVDNSQNAQDPSQCVKDDLTESELIELIQHFELISNSVSQQQTPATTNDLYNRYASHLHSLNEMGFTDNEKNVQLLVRFDGNIVAVVDELLKSPN